MEVKIIKATEEDLNRLNVTSWPVWEKEVSEFDWHYDSTEQFYVLEGKVEVTYGDRQSVTFGTGDFVTFPAGMSCHWKVLEPIKKHYNFI